MDADRWIGTGIGMAPYARTRVPIRSLHNTGKPVPKATFGVPITQVYMLRQFRFALIASSLLVPSGTHAQDTKGQFVPALVGFYNIENLFDDIDDPALSGDDEDIDITQDPMDDGKDQVICGAEFEEDLLPFFDTYCNRCHATDLEPWYRNFAPEDLNFDTLEGVLDQPARLRASLLDGSGQPPSAPYPLATERDNMIAWIDCATGEGARE